jgi:tRNA(Arg) A34 adenosine deaminase TadA
MTWGGIGEIFNPGERHANEELQRKRVEARIPGNEGDPNRVDLEAGVVHIQLPPGSVDLTHLRRCIALAAQALDAGDEPFGSVLVDAEGVARHEDRNRVGGGDETRHPELELARWAANHLTADERAAATVYTSGEHCPMCSAAHAWVGLGRIVYVASSAQLSVWRTEFGLSTPSPVAPLGITDVAPAVPVEGPVAALESEIKELHRRDAYRRLHPS